jgi:hypothetical protein
MIHFSLQKNIAGQYAPHVPKHLAVFCLGTPPLTAHTLTVRAHSAFAELLSARPEILQDSRIQKKVPECGTKLNCI